MLWIVGKIFADFQQYLDEHALPYAIFWDQALPMPTTYSAVRITALDFSRPDQLVAQLEGQTDLDVTALVVAGYENYVLPAAYLAAHFQVPGLSVEAAQAATDKAIMRDRFQAYDPALTPDYTLVTEWDDIENFLATHSFPVMLKPANLMKSLLVTQNASLPELRHNYETLTKEIANLYRRYNIRQAPKVIIESFLAGSMHTVAGFVNERGELQVVNAIVDCITAQEVGKNDNFLFSRQLPTQLSADDQTSVLRVAERGVKALGLTSTPVHAEIMLTETGPKIIEIGARIGGYRTRMYEYGCGLDLYAGTLNISYGQPVELTPTKSSSCAVIELFPDEEGTFTSLSALSAIEALPSAKRVSLKAQPGTVVGRANHGFKATAVIILVNDDAQQLAQDSAFVQAEGVVTLA